MATQCVRLDQLNLSPFEHAIWYACDLWVVPHIVTVALLCIFIKRPWIAWLLSFIWELIEAWIVYLFKGFGIFYAGPAANQATENLVESLVVDVFYCGALGAIVGWLYYETFRAPTVLTISDFWKRPYIFFYYVFFYLLSLVGYFGFYGYETGGFRLGVLLSVIIQGAVLLLGAYFEPKGVWNGYTKRDRIIFWSVQYAYAVVLAISNLFNWLYSAYIQALLLTGIFIIALFITAAATRNYWWKRYYISFDEVYRNQNQNQS
jgi:hypothetical protein